MSNKLKTVCIVGAGPGGLVAAKTFFQTGEFSVTVYEKSERIGGIWALDKSSTNGFLSPFTPTNLSRFTVSFSDLDWNSIDLNENGEVPMYPKAWMVNRYCETYREKYIPRDMIRVQREVVKAERHGDTWEIDIMDHHGNREARKFDHLVLASGFFSRPRLTGQGVPDLAQETTSRPPVSVIHSSQFRRLDDLCPGDAEVNGRILILGGGNSSGETATAIAMQLSNSQWSPDRSNETKWQNCKIVHVTPRPMYSLPPFLEYDTGSRSYVPLDWKLYDFGKRPPTMPSYAGRQPQVVRNIVHNTIQSMVGGDFSDVSSALSPGNDPRKGSPYVALTESYSEFVQSGLIDVVRGRVKAIEEGTSSARASAVLSIGENETKLDDIVAVVDATGYIPTSALDVLDDETKSAIKYDPTSTRLPAILEQWQTMNRAVPNLALIGFYEGPYWPIMEYQSRLTAARWLSNDALPPTNSYEKSSTLTDLRQAMQHRESDVPQFWFSDYLGYMDDMASVLGLEKTPSNFREREGPTSPARYTKSNKDCRYAAAIMNDLQKRWHACLDDGRYVSRAVFRALHGKWIVERKITSTNPGSPSDTFRGIASFHPRFPTRDSHSTETSTADLEYLYIESGDITTTKTAIAPTSLSTHRRYIYRYTEATDTLSVSYVKLAGDLEADYLFHNLAFAKPAEARERGGSVAKGYQLCGDDIHELEYLFPMKGTALRNFEVVCSVKGPKEGYLMVTRYEKVPSSAMSEGN